jgi:hypothetical protein
MLQTGRDVGRKGERTRRKCSAPGSGGRLRGHSAQTPRHPRALAQRPRFQYEEPPPACNCFLVLSFAASGSLKCIVLVSAVGAETTAAIERKLCKEACHFLCTNSHASFTAVRKKFRISYDPRQCVGILGSCSEAAASRLGSCWTQTLCSTTPPQIRKSFCPTRTMWWTRSLMAVRPRSPSLLPLLLRHPPSLPVTSPPFSTSQPPPTPLCWVEHVDRKALA